MVKSFILLLMLLASGAACAGTDIQSFLAGPASASLSSGQKTELEKIYALRGYQPAWDLSTYRAADKIAGFLKSVEALAAYHGLDQDRYLTGDIRKLAAQDVASKSTALEVMITSSMLRLAHDLHGDDIDPGDVYTGWTYKRAPMNVPQQFNDALNAGKLEDFFDHLSPQGKPYADLAKALQTYLTLQHQIHNWPVVAPGPSLRPGDQNPRIVQLRARLAAENYRAAPAARGDDYFDDELARSLIDYQLLNGLTPDGHAGAQTVAALNIPIAGRILQIRANMERWRHMPEDFPPDRYSLVNIPDFTVTVVDGGHKIYVGKIIDGKPDRQTPFIKSDITTLVIDPPWNVPVSIARKDILPKLRENRHYLEKLDIDIQGRTTDPHGVDIDWKNVSDDNFHYQLRQSPGDLNSLGKLKFNFANPFDVYMHGTPHQELFGKAERDFSSGCVRLEDPVRFAEIVLAGNKDQGGWSAERINTEVDADATRWVKLAQSMPVFFQYWSVFNDDNGKVNFRTDIYDYDASLIEKIRQLAPVY